MNKPNIRIYTPTELLLALEDALARNHFFSRRKRSPAERGEGDDAAPPDEPPERDTGPPPGA